MNLPSIADIEAARARCGARLRHTPLLRSAVLDRAVGGTVLLKAENLQHTGSFKLRGAMNTVLALAEAGHKGGVVAFSSGNHAQAVAYSAAAAGMAATIFMPADAPAIKTRMTRSWGAQVVPFDRLRDDREALAQAEAERTGAAIIPPFDKLEVVAGQGTAGLEVADDMAAQNLTPDAVLVPVSGGGFLAGVTLALQSRFPSVRSYAVEPEGRDDMRRSLVSGVRERNEPGGSTLCDGLLSPDQGALTFAVNKDRVAGGVVVSDEAVLRAMAFAFLHLKLVLEPSGAVGLAALLSGAFDGRDKTSVVLLSGGNVDPATFERALAFAE